MRLRYGQFGNDNQKGFMKNKSFNKKPVSYFLVLVVIITSGLFFQSCMMMGVRATGNDNTRSTVHVVNEQSVAINDYLFEFRSSVLFPGQPTRLSLRILESVSRLPVTNASVEFYLEGKGGEIWGPMVAYRDSLSNIYWVTLNPPEPGVFNTIWKISFEDLENSDPIRLSFKIQVSGKQKKRNLGIGWTPLAFLSGAGMAVIMIIMMGWHD